MTPESGREPGAGPGYARSIERRWSELLESPVVLSPRDWSRIEDWRRRGIPLAIVVEAMVAAARPERPRRRSPRLSDVTALVEEAWSVLVEGRLASPDEAGPGLDGLDPSGLWRRRMAAAPPDSPLARLLAELIARWEAGEEPERIDAELDRRLGAAVDPALDQRARREVADQLA